MAGDIELSGFKVIHVGKEQTIPIYYRDGKRWVTSIPNGLKFTPDIFPNHIEPEDIDTRKWIEVLNNDDIPFAVVDGGAFIIRAR